MAFRITGLSPEPFKHLYGLSDEALKDFGVLRYHVSQDTGFPDRIEMRDAKRGETVLLLNHFCQPADTPYKASHAIFVLEGALKPYASINKVPQVMETRLLSLRGFDREHMMVEADVIDGHRVANLIDRFFSNPNIAYIHAHNAKQGCFSGRIDRVSE
ncbi:MAG: DUF1203 domain-containing protein [Hyphomicrobiales bacterium]